MGKGEIARYEQFLLFPQCFQEACFPGASKGVIVWEWVKKKPKKQNVFVKHKYPRNRHFLKILNLIFDLDLDRWPGTLYQQKGLVTRYTRVKYEGPYAYQPKDMANEKVFADKQIDKQMYRRAKT